MERNVSFDAPQIQTLTVHLSWGQLELFADDVERIQVLAAGDETSVNDLRIVQNGGELLVEQPQYGFTLSLTEGRWLQVCVRVPKSWAGVVRCVTLSSMLSARSLHAAELSLETVSGELRAARLTADHLALKTISGDIRGDELHAPQLTLRSVSGNAVLDGLHADSVKCSSVSGEQTYNMAESFQSVEVTAVSGSVVVTAPVDAMNVSLRSISGEVHTEGVQIVERGDAPSVRVTGVSANLTLVGLKD